MQRSSREAANPWEKLHRNAIDGVIRYPERRGKARRPPAVHLPRLCSCWRPATPGGDAGAPSPVPAARPRGRLPLPDAEDRCRAGPGRSLPVFLPASDITARRGPDWGEDANAQGAPAVGSLRARPAAARWRRRLRDGAQVHNEPRRAGGRGGGGPSREPAGDKAVGEAPPAPPASAASLGGSPGGPRCPPPPAGDATHRGGEVRCLVLRPSTPPFLGYFGFLGVLGCWLFPPAPWSWWAAAHGRPPALLSAGGGRMGGWCTAAELPALWAGEPRSACGNRAVLRSSLRAFRGDPSCGGPVSVIERFSPRVSSKTAAGSARCLLAPLNGLGQRGGMDGGGGPPGREGGVR